MAWRLSSVVQLWILQAFPLRFCLFLIPLLLVSSPMQEAIHEGFVR